MCLFVIAFPDVLFVGTSLTLLMILELDVASDTVLLKEEQVPPLQYPLGAILCILSECSRMLFQYRNQGAVVCPDATDMAVDSSPRQSVLPASVARSEYGSLHPPERGLHIGLEFWVECIYGIQHPCQRYR